MTLQTFFLAVFHSPRPLINAPGLRHFKTLCLRPKYFQSCLESFLSSVCFLFSLTVFVPVFKNGLFVSQHWGSGGAVGECCQKPLCCYLKTDRTMKCDASRCVCRSITRSLRRHVICSRPICPQCSVCLGSALPGEV